MYGPQNDRLLLVQYESLTSQPVRTLGAILALLCLLGAWAVDLTSVNRRSYGLR